MRSNKLEKPFEIPDKNNKVYSHIIMIKQKTALARVHSNLSQSKIMLDYYFLYKSTAFYLNIFLIRFLS